MLCGVTIIRAGRLCSLVSSFFIANNIILLAELTGQELIGRAIGQAKLRAPSAGSQGELLQAVALTDRTFLFRKGHCIRIRTLPSLTRIFEFQIKSDSPNA